VGFEPVLCGFLYETGNSLHLTTFSEPGRLLCSLPILRQNAQNGGQVAEVGVWCFYLWSFFTFFRLYLLENTSWWIHMVYLCSNTIFSITNSTLWSIIICNFMINQNNTRSGRHGTQEYFWLAATSAIL
jgi:magnesium-transporting ATPase (P-type)